ncbi:hypothetical protein U879_01505 [Defluviimonas sp. 20V17]|nr:hypothetical protein U879_01505 [Defluviimonas sp. 20V17]
MPDAEPEITAALTGQLGEEGILARDRLRYDRCMKTDTCFALDVDGP